MAPPQRRPGKDATQLPGHGVGVSNDREHFAGAGVGVSYEVPPVQAAGVAGAAEVPAICLCLAARVALQLRYGAREEEAKGQRRAWQDAPQLPWHGGGVPDQGERLRTRSGSVGHEVPAIALGLGVVVAEIHAVAGYGRVHLGAGVVRHQGIADGLAHLALGAVLGYVQGGDRARHHAVDFGLSVGLRLFVTVAVDLQRVGVVLQAGAQGSGEVQVPQHVGALQQFPQAGAFDKVTGTKAAIMAASVCADV